MTDNGTSPLEVLTARLIEIRDTRSANKRVYEEQDKPLRDEFETIENALLAHANKLGVTSMRVPSGSISVITKTRSSGEDWAAIYQWVVVSGRMDIFNRKLNDKVVEELIENDGGPPPGVKVSRERTIQVRRS